MVRKLVVVFTSVVLFAAAHAKALGLGEIVLDSALNQPLNAQIALLQLGDVRPEQISVQIANETDFARFSIERESFLSAIRFNIQSQGADTFVHLSTLDAVREPYLSFVLETRWPSGRLLSEHTVLLDLPAFAPSGAAAPIQQAIQVQDSTSKVPQNQSITAQSSSLDSDQPARFAAPAEPVEPADEEPVVQVPAQVEEVANDTPAAAPAPAAAPTPAPVARNANLDETVTIGSDDTLWDIALQVRPDSSVSVQQTMLALQSLNRESFIADNINMVRRGQVLRVPTLEQIRALSAREAMSEVARQNQLFDNRRNVPLASQPLTAQPQNTAATAPGRGELSVVSIDNAEPSDASSGSSSQSAELDARIASLEDALAVQQEEADRAARINAELNARLGLLEEQINSAQEIIRLRDLELAQLQQALEEAAAAEPEPVDPPTVITMAPEKTLVEQILDTLVANTFVLVALIGLMILMLVFVLLRRNRAADQAVLAGMDVDAGEQAVGESSADDSEIPEGNSAISAELSVDELDEIMNIADSADAALISDDIDFDIAVDSDSDEIKEVDSQEAGIEEIESKEIEPVDADLEVVEPEKVELEEVDPEEVAAVLAAAAERAKAQKPFPPVDILEEADALIAYERFDDAEIILRDAIVREPDRVDLRLKVLEVFVGKQDAVGFKLQETEIRDMGQPNVEGRIATLRSQLLGDTDHELLEDGEEDFFDELSELDDMELALDLEASAEVDDSKVLTASPDSNEEAALEDLSFDSGDDEISNDIDFDFAPDEGEAETVEALVEEAEEREDTDAGIELSFASPEPGAVIEDFDDEEDEAIDLSAEFDLSGSDEEVISFAVEDDEPTLEEAESAEPVEEADDNAIDFDFDFVVDEPEPVAESPELLVEETSSTKAADPEPEVDFDFAVMDDMPTTAAPVAESSPEPKAEVAEIEFDADDGEEAEIEFDIEGDDDAEIEFLDDEDDEIADIDFSFDDSSFDLAIDEEESPAELEGRDDTKPELEPAAQAVEDPFDDLQFVDESIESAANTVKEDDSEEDDDLDFLSDADEAATKLDLARAYFEMGDHEGAREILEEVQKEGTEEQIKDATELLNKL